VRAWQVSRLGPPEEALALVDVEPRPPGDGEALVDVAAVGLNFPDLLLCEGRYQERPALPFSPGYEAAGVVAETGRGCRIAVGQRVIVVPELPHGALQQRLTVPETQLYPVPEWVEPATAAVLHIAYATAHVGLHHRAGLRPGETVLVTGAAGGVGSAAVQLARAGGARVIAAVTGARHAATAARSGADRVVDLAQEDLVPAVRAATDGRGADVVLDVVGGAGFDEVRRCAAFEGRVVVAGFTSGVIPSAPANHLLLRNYAIVGLHLALYRRHDPQRLRGVHAELLALLERGAIAPVIEARLPFAEAPRALRRLADRAVGGRLVLMT
jgi:NADPH:quinone reductase